MADCIDSDELGESLETVKGQGRGHQCLVYWSLFDPLSFWKKDL